MKMKRLLNGYIAQNSVRKRGAHDAIKSIREACYRERVGVIIDADVSKFFDAMPHDWMREILRKRVNDGRIIRFIGKWLNADVVEKDNIHHPSCGSPQGGVISPLIASIFLHHVLDEWYATQVGPRLKGRSFPIRFADDFVIGCENETDWHRLKDALPKRFGKHGLKIHPDKSKVVRFKWVGRNVKKSGNGTFDFLGFTHYWSKSRNGNWVVKRMTSRKRHRRALRNVFLYCRNNKHEPVIEQHKDLCSKLPGLYIYYDIRGNYRLLLSVYMHAKESWRRWLGRRTRDGFIGWEKFAVFHEVWKLPRSRIMKMV